MSGKAFTSAPVDAGTGLRRAALVLAEGFRDIARALRNRREVARLADLDDRTLKDIGLLRSDVEGALLQPFHKDPSKILCLRRGATRARARSAPLTTPRISGPYY